MKVHCFIALVCLCIDNLEDINLFSGLAVVYAKCM